MIDVIVPVEIDILIPYTVAMRKITTPCAADGCDRYGNNAGYCDMHIQRVRKYGDPHFVKQPRGVSELERFEFWTAPNEETGCREWTGERDRRGYGKMYVKTPNGKRRIMAHRWAYTHFVGPIPDGLLVCHHCDNPPCTTIEHLFLGTHQDNRIDCVRKGRHNVSHKLTVEIAEQIRARHRELGSQRKVAAEFGLAKSTVGVVLRGERWT